MFVAEKSGLIKVFASVNATTPTVFADLRPQVYGAYDHGLLGMALDPHFPTNAVHLCAVHARRADRRHASGLERQLPDPPGAEVDGCVVSARLSRLQAAGNVMTGTEKVLINDWCQQYSSHSIGTVLFGADGALYASAGDGADVHHDRLRPGRLAEEPVRRRRPSRVGGTEQTPPRAEGGALRSQDLSRLATRSHSTARSSGSMPATGAARPDNPNAASSDPNVRRIVATGLRQPFRMTTRPGTNELWIGDVGWNTWEEIDRVANPTTLPIENFGWPCYEGLAEQPAYEALEPRHLQHAVRDPAPRSRRYFKYSHSASVVSTATAARPVDHRSPAVRSIPRPAATTRRSTPAPSSSPTTRDAASGSC